MNESQVWTEYKPPSNEWLASTNLSNTQLRKARRQYAGVIARALNLDEEQTSNILGVADELIGKSEMLENQHLGQVLHLRRLSIERLSNCRAAVRMVRRWDRRMIKALPDAK